MTNDRPTPTSEEIAEARLRNEEIAADLTTSAIDEAARRTRKREDDGYLRALSDAGLIWRIKEQQRALAAARDMETNAAPMIRARLERDLEDARTESQRRGDEGVYQ